MQIFRRPASSFNPNYFKDFIPTYSPAGEMDLPQTFSGGWIECVCVYACLCAGANKRKKDQNCPSANQKKTIIILNQRWKDTKSCSHAIQRSGPDQNNYCIISPSDNPRLIQLWLGGRKAGLWASTSRSHHADWLYQWLKNVFVREIELHHPVTQLLELLHCRVIWWKMED